MKKQLLFLVLILSIKNAQSQNWLGGGNPNFGANGITLANNFLGTVAGNNIPVRFGTNGASQMILQNGTGFVGIGVAVPNDILHIHDGNNSVLHVTNGGTGVGSPTLGVKFGLFNNTLHAVIAQQSSNPLSRILFTTNGAPSFANTKMTIINNGNVGIGTGFITPNNKLDVEGGDIDVNTPQRSYMIADSSVLWHKGGNSNLFIGIGAGNSHPNNTNVMNTLIGSHAGFNLVGAANAGSNVIIGANAGFNHKAAECVFIGTEAGYNSLGADGATFIGYRAGFSYNNPGPSGTGNTFVGYRSGFSTLATKDNTFFGANTGTATTTGDNNSFLGLSAGVNNTTGSFNCFFGNLAGGNNGTRNNNNSFGVNAGNAGAGDDNIFIGTQAGLRGVGNKNVVLGNNAMSTPSVSNENVTIGFDAANAGDNNNFNVFMGSQAVPAITTSSLNALIGYKTAFNQTVGISNAYLGELTGNNVRGGSNNTLIGAKADVTTANSTTVTNAAAIGANAKVTNANHMILGDNNVNVGIGLSADANGPAKKLEIKDNVVPNSTTANPSIPGTFGASGIRFTNLTSATTPTTNPGLGLLGVDALGNAIYVLGGGATGITAAQNGLSLVGTSTVELGGTLLHPTAIDFSNQVLDYTNGATTHYERLANGAVWQFASGPVSLGQPAGFSDFALITNTSGGVGKLVQAFPITGFAAATSGLIGEEVLSYGTPTNGIGGINGDVTGIYAVAQNTTSTIGNNYAIDAWAQGASSTITAVNVGVRSRITGFNSKNNYGFYSIIQGVPAANEDIGVNVFSMSNASTTTNIGGKYVVTNGQDVYGLWSLAQGGTSTNYGVYAEAAANGTLNIGVYGKAAVTGGTVGPSYAGYFQGDVVKTGSDNFTSDLNLKQNVDSIPNAIGIINSLQPITFNYKQSSYPSMNLPGGIQYGIGAQPTKTVLPAIVNTITHPAQMDSLGNITVPSFTYLAVEYQQLTPIIISAMQQYDRLSKKQDSTIQAMQSQIAALTSSVSSCCSSSAIRTTPQEELNKLTVNLSNEEIIVLNQNTPNPFAEQTTITYIVPEKYGYAQIIFRTIEGKIIKTVDIIKKGGGQLNVFANDLSSGMYTYSLEVDGKVFATKKMVKSE